MHNYDGNSHVKADAVIQTLSFTGLELNPVVNNSISLLLLAKSISDSQHYTETEISEFRTNFINNSRILQGLDTVCVFLWMKWL